jgi:hypothetical protein
MSGFKAGVMLRELNSRTRVRPECAVQDGLDHLNESAIAEAVNEGLAVSAVNDLALGHCRARHCVGLRLAQFRNAREKAFGSVYRRAVAISETERPVF